MTKHFLQSQEWEGFQRSLGRDVFRIQDMLVIKLPLAVGKSYLYIAGFSNFQFSIFNFQSIFNSQNFQTLTKKNNAVFLKFEPMAENESVAKALLKMGFQKSAKEIQPQRTIVLDIDKPEEQLLAEMHKKTRYNIGLAQKKRLQFEIREEGGVDLFWGLLKKTTERDRFVSQPKEYYRKLLELPITQLFAVKNRDKAIAASIVVFYENQATYLHGASDYEYRKLMAPYLLHWETIKYAKENGYKKYDFWGINKKKWPGVTRFKMGFGGKEVEYIGSYDYVFQSLWYRVYNLRNKLRQLI